MRFKHAFHVFIDNFSTTYKLLLYKLFVAAVVIALSCAVIIPSLNNILDTAQAQKLSDALSDLWHAIFGDFDWATVKDKVSVLTDAFNEFKALLLEKSWLLALDVVFMAVVVFIEHYLSAVGDYAAGYLVNYRMTLHANSSFTITLLKNIKSASLFAIIQAPISFLFTVVDVLLIWLVIFHLPGFILIKIFLVAVIIITLYALKFTLLVDWLPAHVHDKKNNREALKYSLSMKQKRSLGVMSTSIVLTVLMLAANVIIPLFTFGAGILITLPATELVFMSYRFVNYYDNNGLKYFVDEYTVIGPKKEAPVSREQFFKGDD